MRAVLLLLVTTAIALGVLLVGCGGDEQPAQSTQQQAQTQQESAAQDEADAAERSTSSAQSSVGEAAQDEQAIAQDAADSEQSEFSDPLLAEATAAYEAWVDDIETMELYLVAEYVLFGLEMQLPVTAVFRTDPPAVWMTIDVSDLFGAAGDAAGESTEAAAMLETFAEMQVLATADGQFMTFSGLGGWIDLNEGGDLSLLDLSALLSQTGIAAAAELGQALHCNDGTYDVSYDRLDGENVWLVNCKIEDTILPLTDPPTPVGSNSMRAETRVELMQLRLAISRETGAPLRSEAHIVFAGTLGGLFDSGDGDAEMPSFHTSAVSTLRSWNEPVELPTPEPLVDPSLLDSFFGEDTATDSASNPGSDATFAPSELLEADELLALATEWLNTVDELHVQIEAQAVAAGESRTASTRISTSWSRGMFEVTTILDQAHIFGVLWTRDGIWVGEGRADEFSYQASTPELQGFAGLTVDEFLALPDLYNFGSYASALDLSWLTRTIEGGGPPIYELVIESGPRLPGDDYFDELGELIKAEASEFLADSASIESIEYYSTVITINGASGEIVSQVTIAEFQSNAVDVLFTASIIPFAGGPIEFSIPPD
ncbi:MAG: hypothetical protein F4Y69_01110 [Chloroflexi bacterium]|nr:hypothetical protein [Chloroflexota bacterium]MYF22571.1 hypothetical protein [Chloroflexota bacterium]